MTTAAPTTISPRSADSGSAPALNSPRSRRVSVGRGVSSPWTQVVRGDPESIVSGGPSTSAASATAGGAPSSPSSSGPCQDQIANSCSDRSPSEAAASVDHSSTEDQPDNFDNGNGGSAAAKKPAWNKPSNGALEVGPVMGGVSWPALSESTRASPKSSTDSPKSLSDGSSSLSQGTGIASSSLHKQVINNNSNPSTNSNNVGPSRQRSMKQRGGGGGGSSSGVSANGGFAQPPPSPQPQHGSPGEIAPTNSVKSAGDSYAQENVHKGNAQRGGGFGPQSNIENDHHPQRNSFRRNQGGSYHHGSGSRRDQDRGNPDWNPHRSFTGGRDNHMQPQRGFPRGYIRPAPPTTAPFIPPSPVALRPFGGPIYPEVASPVIFYPGPPPPDSLRGVPILSPIPPVYFAPIPDPQLQAKIVYQIEYYFSNENLIKDIYLRQNMDDHGWVPVQLIAGFKKVAILTENIQVILDALRNSTIVEIQGDKIRRRNDWPRWIMPPTVQFSAATTPTTPGRSNSDILNAQIQGITLDEMNLSRSSSGDLSSSQSQQSGAGGEGTGQVPAGFERPKSIGISSK